MLATATACCMPLAALLSVALDRPAVDVARSMSAARRTGRAFTASRTITVNSASASAPFAVDGAVLPKTLMPPIPLTCGQFSPTSTGAASATLS